MPPYLTDEVICPPARGFAAWIAEVSWNLPPDHTSTLLVLNTQPVSSPAVTSKQALGSARADSQRPDHFAASVS